VCSFESSESGHSHGWGDIHSYGQGWGYETPISTIIGSRLRQRWARTRPVIQHLLRDYHLLRANYLANRLAYSGGWGGYGGHAHHDLHRHGHGHGLEDGYHVEGSEKDESVVTPPILTSSDDAYLTGLLKHTAGPVGEFISSMVG